MSLYTDPGPLAFPQVPHKKPKNSTQLYLPASVLMAIQQKSYPSQRNRLSPLPPPFFFNFGPHSSTRHCQARCG